LQVWSPPQAGDLRPLLIPPDPLAFALKSGCGTGSDDIVELESVCATSVKPEQLAPVLLRLEDIEHAQPLPSSGTQDALATLSGFGPLCGLVQCLNHQRLDDAKLALMPIAAKFDIVIWRDEDVLLDG